jgi:hypothetical protein
MGSVTANGNNQISGFTYDASGNTQNDGTIAYSYNAESQMKTAFSISSLERMAGTTRLELATSAVTETTRKPHKTTRIVGWVVGWKIMSLASGTPHRKSIA